jgi:hypothetical protein
LKRGPDLCGSGLRHNPCEIGSRAGALPGADRQHDGRDHSPSPIKHFRQNLNASYVAFAHQHPTRRWESDWPCHARSSKPMVYCWGPVRIRTTEHAKKIDQQLCGTRWQLADSLSEHHRHSRMLAPPVPVTWHPPHLPSSASFGRYLQSKPVTGLGAVRKLGRC